MLAAASTGIATAQPGDDRAPAGTATAAVSGAKNAFEYRDFERVVDLLDPWLHPRRILDPVLAVQARRLLGVSLHVLGRTKEAKEEFSELLLLDPRHKLDPFLVPPAVIQTFENVRASMRPTLDAILRDRGERAEPETPTTGPPTVRLVPIPPLAIALLPVGIPQFAADEPGWGLLWAVLQVGFLTLNLVAFDQASRNDGSAFGIWTGLQYGGLAGFLGAWTASGLQGYSQLKDQQQRRLALPPSLEGPSSSPLTPASGPRLGIGWEF